MRRGRGRSATRKRASRWRCWTAGSTPATPDLAGAVLGAQDFTGSASGIADKFGHGTHVAGIVTGDGAALSGRYVGVAPDATLLDGKADNGNGNGQGLESWVIAGREWAVQQGAQVVNTSLGGPTAHGTEDLMGEMVDRLTGQSGTLFAVAAGNSGPDAGTVGSPGTADWALTVGVVDGDQCDRGQEARSLVRRHRAASHSHALPPSSHGYRTTSIYRPTWAPPSGLARLSRAPPCVPRRQGTPFTCRSLA
ncbi:S8 family serine peptidase [Dactylosporangium sp. NBC_01737]|nr:S8 family serine peptidase [Dactylosporangium sp. NBC_01737]